MKLKIAAIFALLSIVLVSQGCSQFSGNSSSPGSPVKTELSLEQRISAVENVLANEPRCSVETLGSYYWEFGDKDSRLASGSVGDGSVQADTMMSIASASKWVYSAYVIEKFGVRDEDATYLNFTSGYTQMVIPMCGANESVAECLSGKDQIVSAHVGKYFYGSGHMQKHAIDKMGIGDMGIKALSDEIFGVVGETGMFYSQPQMAGGLVGSATTYATFLKRILNAELRIHDHLGERKVCATEVNCEAFIGSPAPDDEAWNYSLGHWVEDDPGVGDGAFSSAGAFGFYPWIDASKTFYGILARRTEEGPSSGGFVSVECGRLMRKAWLTGVSP